MIFWGGGIGGPTAAPGEYTARLTVNDKISEKSFRLLPNPISSSSVGDMKEQFDLLIEIRDKLTETHQCILDIRSMRDQLNDLLGKLDKEVNNEIIKEVSAIKDELTSIEENLYQTKNRSSQDPLNFPIKLNNKLAGVASVVSAGDWKPTKQSYETAAYLTDLIDAELAKFAQLKKERIEKLNQTLAVNKIAFIKM